MSALMKTRTTGELFEIDLSVKAPLAELALVEAALKKALNDIGHEIRPVNEAGEEVFSSAEVFPEESPGMALHGLRVMEGISQKEFARRLGIMQHHVSEMEAGKRPITIEMAKRIGETFKISYKVFL